MSSHFRCDVLPVICVSKLKVYYGAEYIYILNQEFALLGGAKLRIVTYRARSRKLGNRYKCSVLLLYILLLVILAIVCYFSVNIALPTFD